MEAEARAVLEAGLQDPEPDLLSAIRLFNDEVDPTDDELRSIFDVPRDECRRSITLGDER